MAVARDPPYRSHSPMRKVLLIGSGGAGKSTLARNISARTGLPLVHLDALYWRAGWVEPPKDEWRRTVEALLREDAWVMDGNYGGTLDLRLAACDTVVYLNLPTWLCLWRVLKRRIAHRGTHRPEMAPGCNERLNAEFLWWILTYRMKNHRAMLRRLAAAEGRGKRVVVLDSPRAVAEFLISPDIFAT